MLREIFEKKKFPFYHFGQLFPLAKIDKNHFKTFIITGMNGVFNNSDSIADEILQFTDGHPYYTQQLSFTTWNIINQVRERMQPVSLAIEETIQVHDFDYERLWITFNNMDKKTMTSLAQRNNSLLVSPLSKAANIGPASTVFSSLKRLLQNGNVIKSEKGYEIDDPFFKQWIIKRRNI